MAIAAGPPPTYAMTRDGHRRTGNGDSVMHRLTRDQARRIAVQAQLLEADRPDDVVGIAEQLGAIKIDPTATIAPAEHTILWSRIGSAYDRAQLSKAVESDRLLFEFDGAFRPVSLLPLMLPAMRRWPRRESSRQWLEANDRFRTEVLARLRAEGPLLAGQIPDTADVARAPDGWSGSNQVVHMLDFLHRQGEVAVAGRHGRHRRWDLAERVYPPDLPEYDDEEAERLLNERRLQAAGIAKQRSPWTPVGDAGEPATIDGMRQKWRVDPEALTALENDGDGRAAFLSPYDGMLFDRPRLRELFEFDYVLEQFKPKPQRKYGYFAHPILMGDRFVGMLDAEIDLEHDELRVRAVHEFEPFDEDEHAMVHAEIADLGEWLSVDVPEW
ncbi:DNA glycosylase AlkZ-like family protein [Leifsonia shinshuensis]|uniref:DNA glycosylase AlkZ-like family protein n=1 Tax=Leifsonia shinshuensis TaxID=150026 RepID=UPI001F5FE0D4|nr:crosslink repair DNA glycosylase YcaQ family protein [Leifsonia shinshuensis]